jgi:hypothetical protein
MVLGNKSVFIFFYFETAKIIEEIYVHLMVGGVTSAHVDFTLTFETA